MVFLLVFWIVGVVVAVLTNVIVIVAAAAPAAVVVAAIRVRMFVITVSAGSCPVFTQLIL